MKLTYLGIVLAGFVGLVVVLINTGHAAEVKAERQVLSWYAGQNINPPRKNKIIYCQGYGCAKRQGYNFTRSDLAKLRSILRRGRSSAKAERKAISKAVSWYERRMGKIAGTSSDKAKTQIGNAKLGQLDCVDETANTTNLLIVAQANKWLKYHKVKRPVARGFLFDGRYPHVTAVVAEKKTEKRWAIDSWVQANGKAPEIKPIKKWLLEK